MIKLIDIILEGKQVGPLYHFTGLNNLSNILKNDTLNKGTRPDSIGISFTRDKNFHLKIKNIDILQKHSLYGEVRIMLDGDKLSNNYKISPFRAKGFDKENIKLNPKTNQPKFDLRSKSITSKKIGKQYISNDENEEIINQNITSVSKYINHITLNMDMINYISMQSFYYYIDNFTKISSPFNSDIIIGNTSFNTPLQYNDNKFHQAFLKWIKQQIKTYGYIIDSNIDPGYDDYKNYNIPYIPDVEEYINDIKYNQEEYKIRPIPHNSLYKNNKI